MWDLSSPTRDRTHVPCIGRRILNHWTTRKVPRKPVGSLGDFILFYFILFSSTSLLLPTHLPPPSCTHAQSCSPMDCSPPGSSVHGLFQAGILEWVAISFSTLGDFKAWELRPPGPSAHWHLADTSPSYCTFFLPVLSLWLDKL